jgi:hypothetical protein
MLAEMPSQVTSEQGVFPSILGSSTPVFPRPLNPAFSTIASFFRATPTITA